MKHLWWWSLMTVNSIRYYCLHIQGKISPYSQIKMQSIWIISFAADDLLQSEFVAGYHRAMVTRRKIVERLKRPKWVHLQNRKRVDLRSKLHFLWGTQQPKKLLCVWSWSIVACVVMYYTFYTFYTLCKSSSAACSHAPSSCSPRRRLLAHLQMIPKRRRRDQKTDNRKKGLTKAREGEQDSPLVSDAPLTLNPHRAPTHRQTAGRKRD